MNDILCEFDFLHLSRLELVRGLSFVQYPRSISPRFPGQNSTEAKCPNMTLNALFDQFTSEHCIISTVLAI